MQNSEVQGSNQSIITLIGQILLLKGFCLFLGFIYNTACSLVRLSIAIRNIPILKFRRPRSAPESLTRLSKVEKGCSD